MIIPVAKRLGETKEYYFSKKLREIAVMNQADPKVINLGIGSPDQPPHPDVVATLHAAAMRPDVHGYQSYKGAPELRKAFARWYNRYFKVDLDPEKEILPLIGSKEGIMHLSMTFLNEGDEVLVPDPGYPTYRSAANLAGAVCVPYDLKAELGWKPDLAALEKRDLSRVRLMWVNYPQMPTGAAGDPAFFEQLVAFARKHGLLLCHDNPYSFILPAEGVAPASLLQVPGAREVAVELNSLSKSHNMAGWRIGVLAADEAVVNEVMRFKSNMDSGMFLPMQLAAARALELGPQWYAALNVAYRKRKKKAQELLDLLGCAYTGDQQGMFLWARVPETYRDGYALSDRFLYDARVFITPGGIFGRNGAAYIRISLCSTEETIATAISRIQQAIQSSAEQKTSRSQS